MTKNVLNFNSIYLFKFVCLQFVCLLFVYVSRGKLSLTTTDRLPTLSHSRSICTSSSSSSSSNKRQSVLRQQVSLTTETTCNGSSSEKLLRSSYENRSGQNHHRQTSVSSASLSSPSSSLQMVLAVAGELEPLASLPLTENRKKPADNIPSIPSKQKKRHQSNTESSSLEISLDASVTIDILAEAFRYSRHSSLDPLPLTNRDSLSVASSVRYF